MKKYILFVLNVLIFYGCEGNEIPQDLVKKYETAVNAELRKQVNLVNNEYNDVMLKIPDFKCGVDGSFVKCISNDATFSAGGSELFRVKNIELRSNEIYRGENKGLISIKEYYDELFKNNEKLEISLYIEGFKLSDKAIEIISEIVSKDATNLPNGIDELVLELIGDEYNLRGVVYTTFSDGEFRFDASQKLYSTTKPNSLGFGGSATLKEAVFDALEKDTGVKFDTQTLSINKDFKDKLDSQFDLYFQKFSAFGKEFGSINDTKLDVSLDTKNVFKPYVDMIKGYLSVLRDQDKDEKDAPLTTDVLSLLDDITKTPIYKFNVEVKFQNTLDYKKKDLESIQKITINGRDFTDTFKKLVVTTGSIWTLRK